MLEENEAHGDLLFVDGGLDTDYRSIVYKTFALVEWVAANLRPKFILKTDDDAYVHTGNLIATLRGVRRPVLCELIGEPIKQSVNLSGEPVKGRVKAGTSQSTGCGGPVTRGLVHCALNPCAMLPAPQTRRCRPTPSRARTDRV